MLIRKFSLSLIDGEHPGKTLISKLDKKKLYLEAIFDIFCNVCEGMKLFIIFYFFVRDYSKLTNIKDIFILG